MTSAVTVKDYMPSIDASDIETALTVGDLSKMAPGVRVRYYLAACESAGLNPLTQPFTPLKNQAGQIILYANATAAEQLRQRQGISLRVLSRETLDGLYTVTVAATTRDGRCDEAQGIVDTSGLKGQALANARMKCETKAKRRVTLAICGLGFGAADDAPGQPVTWNAQTGELAPQPSMLMVAQAPQPQDAQDAIDALFGPDERAADERAADDEPEEAQDVAERAVLLDRIHELFGALDRTPDKYLAALVRRAGVADEEALPLAYLARAVELLEQDVELRVAQREASVATTDTEMPF